MWPLIRFSVIGDAWRLYKQHWFVWSVATLLVLCCDSAINGALHGLVKGGKPPGPGGFRLFLPASGVVQFAVYTVVTGFLLGGMIRMASNQLRGRAPRIEDLLSVTDVWFDLLLVGLLCGAAIALGTAVCVIPGFIVFGVLMLAIPLVVERRLPATAAIIQSWHALKSQWLTATFFHVVLAIVSVSGAILCGIGVLFTGPLYSLAIALLFREFFGASSIGASTKYGKSFPEI
jgi:uncharacterized membrane protein